MPVSTKRIEKQALAGGRWAMVLLAGFFVLQLLVDGARSVTLFPFIHFGMYSEPLPQPDSLPVFEVTVDGHRLQPSDYRVYRWDMIQAPLAAVEAQQKSGDFAEDRAVMAHRLGGVYS